MAYLKAKTGRTVQNFHGIFCDRISVVEMMGGAVCDFQRGGGFIILYALLTDRVFTKIEIKTFKITMRWSVGLKTDMKNVPKVSLGFDPVSWEFVPDQILAFYL